MPRRKGNDWDSEPRLGRMLDSHLAALIGVHRSVVVRAREKRGIPKFDPAQTPAPDHLEKVATYGTAEHKRAIEAWMSHGTAAAAAEALGLTPFRILSLIAAAEKIAARAGWSPAHDMIHEVPAGFHVKGVSSYYGADGQLRGQWVKSTKDQSTRLDEILEACERIAEPWRGGVAEIAAPRYHDEDLLCVYPMGDPHFGMFSWAPETGANFDLKIAEDLLCRAADHLVATAPAASEALVINLGDFFHSDDSTNRTRRSGHPLDVDGRRPKILEVGVRAMRRVIERALEKHDRVRVWNMIGNHDDDSSIALGLMLRFMFESNPRVEIEVTPRVRVYHEFGANLIGATHGHTVKPTELPGVMAVEQRAAWGRTTHQHWYTGHIHHDTKKEKHGVIVESFRTLAAPDSYAAEHGFNSGRDMKVDVWHREHGKISRNIIGVERLVA